MNTEQLTTVSAELHAKINNRTATIGIVGMGYVGLPLAVAVFDAGFPVIGFDGFLLILLLPIRLTFSMMYLRN